jgi:hypothetical protein
MKIKFKSIIVYIICIAILIPVWAGYIIKADNKGFKASSYEVVSPEKISGKLNNPGMGWSITEDGTFLGQMDLGTTGTFPEIDAINFTSTWALMEPYEDVYDWSLLDEAIEKWGGLGKIIHLRISTDGFMLPSTYTGAPLWLIEKYNIPSVNFTYTNVSPVSESTAYDITNENYLNHLNLFLTALAQKIKGVECIGDIDVRGYGLWGEWHTGYAFDTTAKKRDALCNMIDYWINAFSENGNILVLSASWDPNYYSKYGTESGDAYTDFYSWAGLDYWWQLENTTFRRDGAGGALFQYDKQLIFEAFRAGKRIYQHGEFNSGAESYTSSGASYSAYDAVNDLLYSLRPNYSTIVGWTASALNDLIESGETDWLDRGFEMLGYRLNTDTVRYAKKVKAGTSFEFMTSWSNTAVGVFPYEYKLCTYLLNSDGSIAYSQISDKFDARTYVQGDINNFYDFINIPNDLKQGDYQLAIAIVDDKGNPAIELGQAGEINDTRTYKIGNITVDNETENQSISERLTYQELCNYQFDNNTSYQITFRYLPKMLLENFSFNENSGYVFNVYSKNSSEIAGYMKWQDVSGEYGYKTVTFNTGNKGDYTAKVYSDNFGDIEITECYVEKYSETMNEGFSKDTVLDDFSASFITSSGRNSKVLTKDIDSNGDIISGDASIKIFSKVSGYTYGLYMNTDKYSLNANTTYTLNFLQQTMNETDTGNGGYYFVAIYDEINNSYKKVGEWYEPDTNYITNKTFTFNTGNVSNGALVFGVYNIGYYVVDNISIIEQKTEILNGENKTNPRNEKTVYNYGFDIEEGFEEGSLNGSSYVFGTFNLFKLSKNPNYVINGNYSGLIYFEQADYSSMYFEIMRTNPDYYNFKAGKTYQITMKYKVIEQSKSAKFYMLFRDNKIGGIGTDLIAYVSGGNSAENSGSVEYQDNGNCKTIIWTITLKSDFNGQSLNNYQFMLGAYNYQVISFDDIMISQK